MKVLITGGTGFIGNHVTRMCLEQGDQVRVMVMPGEDRSPFAGMDVEFVEGNLLDSESLKRAVDDVEGIYHLAALFLVWTKDPTLQFKVNVEGSRALMEAAKHAGVKKIVCTSSVAANGWSLDELSTEETPFNGWHYGSEYIMSKYIAELEMHKMISQGLPAVICRPGYPFGPGDRMPTPTGGSMIMVLQGKMKSYTPGGQTNVDVRDVARGHLLAMEKGRIGEVYILTNKEGNMWNRDFYQLIGRVAGVDNVATQEVPMWALKTASRVMETVANITGKTPKATYKNAMAATQRMWADPSKAVNELGLPQSPIEVAIEDACRWFRDNGYV